MYFKTVFLFVVLFSTNSLLLRCNHLWKDPSACRMNMSTINNGIQLDSSKLISDAPIDKIIPFLSEHIQLSDQILFVGGSTNMVLKLSKLGYGTKKTGFIVCVDENPDVINTLRNFASLDEELRANTKNGKLEFKVANLSNMPEICKQSTYDAIVDYGALDSLHKQSRGKDEILQCIDHLQNGVRLGNILVCLSSLDKKTFCTPFDERFGWVQELDGEPGELSQWYRDKSNIQATQSEFRSLGLYMYVYTNTDNC